jgi:colanic acid biosynthesis protein WcaH
MTKLADDDFLDVIKKTPLVAIDLVIHNVDWKIFVGKRINEPAKDYWFVPGGRIMKGETFNNALIRLMKEELGLHHFNGSYRLLGVYEHFYDTCFFKEDPKITDTHYVVVGLNLLINEYNINYSEIMSQHSEYKWMDVDEILHDDMVHENTKKYFMKNNNRIIF